MPQCMEALLPSCFQHPHPEGSPFPVSHSFMRGAAFEWVSHPRCGPGPCELVAAGVWYPLCQSWGLGVLVPACPDTPFSPALSALRYFGFITKHPADHRFACHVFVSEESTKPLAESVG